MKKHTIKIGSTDPDFNIESLDFSDPVLQPYLGVLSRKVDLLEGCRGSLELLILKGHLVIEYFLNEIINTSIPYGQKYLIDNLNFSKKINLVKRSNFIQEDAVLFIIELNKIRNKCAHRLDYVVSDDDLDILGSTVSSDYVKIKVLNNKEDTLINLLNSIILNLVYDIYKHKKQKGS